MDFPPEPDWTSQDAVVEYLVASQRAVSAKPFDEGEIREIATLAVSRTTNVESSQRNHYAADGSGPWRHRLPEITVPTLVLHGDADPFFPLPHGEAMAREIPGARLVRLDGVGHEFPPPAVWAQVIDEILAHTASLRRQR